MKKYVTIIIVLILSVSIALWLYNYCTTPDNDLSEERLGDVKIGEKYEEKNEDFVKDVRIQLEGKTFYRSVKHRGFIIRKDNKNNQITAVSLFKNPAVKTSRDITIDSTKQDVIDAYGDTYKKSLLPKQQTQFHFKDKEHHIGMKFVFRNDLVKRIEIFAE
ncbi:hypothetical protein BFS35_010060 [Macrococcoides goetzii]|uniref:Uncharacterized protein n=1 Tax=Macrococcoides goetzii TaxID=1891097 RepID=A0A2G5NNR8_9STAP|nr:hypothetical protein [Macrococcus goetzii]RAI80119.1 hypothetical protein BFS35_010060 [Macrococcus goetzii]